MDYCFHSYPRELARQIGAQWDSAGMVGQLPPEDALTSFLSEAYQASLLREEDRAVVCRLILVNPAELGGALVLTAARDIIGFGAEIHIPTHENEVVFPALDIEGEKSVPVRADESGTRHRAAYRLTRDYPECMVTVVSQDGSVRYVGNRSGKVTFWDILSI